jgi:hypothetical protein
VAQRASHPRAQCDAVVHFDRSWPRATAPSARCVQSAYIRICLRPHRALVEAGFPPWLISCCWDSTA